MTHASASFGSLIGSGLRRLAERLAHRGSSLHHLDDRTLADIGLHASECRSIDAGRRGRAEATRYLVATGLGHA